MFALHLERRPISHSGGGPFASGSSFGLFDGRRGSCSDMVNSRLLWVSPLAVIGQMVEEEEDPFSLSTNNPLRVTRTVTLGATYDVADSLGL